MIPLKKEQILLVAQKRRGTIKVCCIFCERRIGWYDLTNIEILLKTHGFTACNECMQHYLSIAIPNELSKKEGYIYRNPLE